MQATTPVPVFAETDLKGRMVRWNGKYAFANSYHPDVYNELPLKVFVHISKVVSPEKMKVGAHIVFDLGPARTPAELPQAWNVRIVANSEEI